MIEQHLKRAEDAKHFIKENLRGVQKTQTNFNENVQANQQVQEKKRQFETKNYTKIPAYLQRFRKEEEAERQETLREIELNKRPPGTRVVTKDEKQRVLDELEGRKAFCEGGIRNMSVTQFTARAQNQYKGYVHHLDDLDRTLNVFQREHVYVAP